MPYFNHTNYCYGGRTNSL